MSAWAESQCREIEEPNFSYGAFGDGGRPQSFGYTGRWGGYSDERVGVLNWHRWYGPGSAKWTARDPIGIQGGVNLYVYALNQVASNWDPTGKNSVIAGTCAVGVLVVGAAVIGSNKSICRPSSCSISSPTNWCDPDTQKQIRSIKDRECKNGSCGWMDSDESLRAKLASAKMCFAVRLLEQEKCFTSIDPGHKAQIGQAALALAKCELIAKTRAILRPGAF